MPDDPQVYGGVYNARTERTVQQVPTPRVVSPDRLESRRAAITARGGPSTELQGESHLLNMLDVDAANEKTDGTYQITIADVHLAAGDIVSASLDLKGSNATDVWAPVIDFYNGGTLLSTEVGTQQNIGTTYARRAVEAKTIPASCTIISVRGAEPDATSDDRSFWDTCSDTPSTVITSHAPGVPSGITYTIWLTSADYAGIDSSGERLNFGGSLTAVRGVRTTTQPIVDLNNSGRYFLGAWHPWNVSYNSSTAASNYVVWYFRAEDNATWPVVDGLALLFQRNPGTADQCYITILKYDSVNGNETSSAMLLENLTKGTDDGYDLYIDVDNATKTVTISYATIGSSTLTTLGSKTFTHALPSSSAFRYMKWEWKASGASQWGVYSIGEFWYVVDGGDVPSNTGSCVTRKAMLNRGPVAQAFVEAALTTSSTLDDLSDVAISSADDKDILQYSASSSAWVDTAPKALSRTNDTNVTLTIGGTAASALLETISLTLGWTGQLAVGRGGTGLSTFTAAGRLAYSTAATTLTTLAIGAAGTLMQSTGSAPTWATTLTGAYDFTGGPTFTKTSGAQASFRYSATELVTITQGSGGTCAFAITTAGTKVYEFDAPFKVAVTSGDGNCRIEKRSNDANGGWIGGRKARGGVGTEAYPQAFDQLFHIAGQGWDESGAGWETQATIFFNAWNTWTATDRSAYITLATTATSDTTKTNRWYVYPAGHFIGAANNTYDIGDAAANGQPRTIYAATSVITPVIKGSSGVLKMVGSGSGDANVAVLEFYDSDGTTRRGYVGDISGSNDDIYLTANTGDVVLYATSGERLRANGGGGISVTGTLTATGLIKTTLTSEQLRLAYSATEYLSVTQGSGGTCAFAITTAGTKAYTFDASVRAAGFASSTLHTIVRTVDNDAVVLWGGNQTGANIELYGGSHASFANNVYIDATLHTFRSQNAGTTWLTISTSGVAANVPLTVNDSIARGSASGTLAIHGGTAANGGGIFLWGGSHASAASDISLRVATTDKLRYDHSVPQWSFESIAVTGVASLTATGLIKTTVTTQQLALHYDASNHLAVTVDANGQVVYNATGSTASHQFSDQVNIPSGSKVYGNSTGDANIALLAFTNSDAVTQRGFVGDAASGNDDIYLGANGGDVVLYANSTIQLRANASGGITVTGPITATGLIKTTLTTQQLALHYSATEHLAVTVGSGGTVAFAITTAGTKAYTFDSSITAQSGSTRPVIVGDPTLTGSIALTGNNGAWSMGLQVRGYSGTLHGGFGFYGSVDALTYYWIGKAYNDANALVHTNVALRPYASGGLTLGAAAYPFGAAYMGSITATGLIQTTLTSQQLALRYDASNHLAVTVASNGAVTYNATGAGANHVFSDNVELDADLNHDGSNVGFFGTAPAAQQANTVDLMDAAIAYGLGVAGVPACYYGSIRCYEVADTITISGSGVANKVQVTSFDTDGLAKGTTPSNADDHVEIDHDGVYWVHFNATLYSAAGTGYLGAIGIWLNNGATQVPGAFGEAQFAGGGGDAHNLSGGDFVSLNDGDTVEVWVYNEDNTTDIVVDCCTLTVRRVQDE